jgi:hypothetical protein
MPEQRCDVTELLISACSHCRPPVELPRAPAASWGAWIAARYPGRCSQCDGRIREDDQIRADGENGWLCETCGAQHA